MKLYGIANCSTVKKARNWLEQYGVVVEFHDFKKHGLEASMVHNWLQQTDWTTLVNRSGMTWRGLPDQYKQRVCDSAAAAALMLEKPSVIKRPLLEQNGKLLRIGFDAATYANIFNQNAGA